MTYMKKKLLMFMLLSLFGCASAAKPYDKFEGFDYHSKLITNGVLSVECSSQGANLKDLYTSMEKDILVYLHKNDLEDIPYIVNMDVFSGIGAKKVEGKLLIDFMFYERLKKEHYLKGEGGVSVIIDPCEKKIVDAFIWIGN